MNGLNFHDEMVSKMSNKSDLGRTCTQSYNDWLDKHDAETRADTIRKFAEWLKNNHFSIVEWKPKEKYSVNRSIETVLDDYEKQAKGENV